MAICHGNHIAMFVNLHNLQHRQKKSYFFPLSIGNNLKIETKEMQSKKTRGLLGYKIIGENKSIYVMVMPCGGGGAGHRPI